MGNSDSDSEHSENETLDSPLPKDKLSHICIFENCKKAKRAVGSYCLNHQHLAIENRVSKSNANKVAKVGFGFLICAVLAWPVLPEILGIDGWEILGWLFAAFVILCIGIIILIVAGIMKLIEKETKPIKNGLDSAPASIIIDSEGGITQLTPPVPKKKNAQNNGVIVLIGFVVMIVLVSIIIPDNSSPSGHYYDGNNNNYYEENNDDSILDWIENNQDSFDECNLVWPEDPFHAAIYSFIAEYELGLGMSIGCYQENYDNLTFEDAAIGLEDDWWNDEGAFDGSAAQYAQQWVDSNAGNYGEETFDLNATFNISEGGLGWETSDNTSNYTPNCTEDDSSGNNSNPSNFTIEANPNIDDPALQCFTKYIEVFGLGVYAESELTDDQVIHAASVLAELLDNDEDGVADDALLLNRLQEKNAMIPMFNEELSPAERAMIVYYQGDGIGAVLYADEVDPTRAGYWGSDASVEEIMHTINMVGHVYIYPEAFGLEPNSSLLTNAMDEARGGQFIEFPSSYPDEAWYHYDDSTCDYGCMAGEYIYWAQVSNMGILNDTATCDGIADEWEPCSKELLESMDVLIYDLITDPQYKLPQLAPDGIYSPETE